MTERRRISMRKRETRNEAITAPHERIWQLAVVARVVATLESTIRQLTLKIVIHLTHLLSLSGIVGLEPCGRLRLGGRLE